jgi:hypothetical protein
MRASQPMQLPTRIADVANEIIREGDFTCDLMSERATDGLRVDDSTDVSLPKVQSLTYLSDAKASL